MPGTDHLTGGATPRGRWSIWSLRQAAASTLQPWRPWWPAATAEELGVAIEAAAERLTDPGRSAQVFKDDASGRVWAGQLKIGGGSIPIVVKQPSGSLGGRALVDRVRRSRVARGRAKTLALLARGLPTELPLLTAEARGTTRAVRHQLAIYARVPGNSIKTTSLAALPLDGRRHLLKRVGATLRATSNAGFVHLDAKTSNWIATPVAGRIEPVMIDCDGVRYQPWNRRPARGLSRFLRALRLHPDFEHDDELAVRDGFAMDASTTR